MNFENLKQNILKRLQDEKLRNFRNCIQREENGSSRN